MNTGLVIALLVEILGIFVIGIGIGYESGTGAPLGHLLITIGAAVVMIGSILVAKLLRV